MAPFSTAVQYVREAKRIERTRLLLMQRAEAALERELVGKPKDLRDLLVEEYVRESAREVVL